MKNFLHIFVVLVAILLPCFHCVGMQPEQGYGTKEAFILKLRQDCQRVLNNANDVELSMLSVKRENINDVADFFSYFLERFPNDSVFFSDKTLANYLNNVIQNSLSNFWDETLFYTEPENLNLGLLNINVRASIVPLFFPYERENSKTKQILLDYLREHIVSLLSPNLFQSILSNFTPHTVYKTLTNPMRQARTQGLFRKYLYFYKKSLGFQETVMFSIFRRGILMESMIAFVNAARDACAHSTAFSVEFNKIGHLKEFIHRNLYNNEEAYNEKAGELAQHLFNQINYSSSRWWHQYRWTTFGAAIGLIGSGILLLKYREKFQKTKPVILKTNVERIKIEEKPEIVVTQPKETGLKVDETQSTSGIPSQAEISWKDIIGAGATKVKHFLQDIIKRGGSPEGVERHAPPPGPR